MLPEPALPRLSESPLRQRRFTYILRRLLYLHNKPYKAPGQYFRVVWVGFLNYWADGVEGWDEAG